MLDYLKKIINQTDHDNSSKDAANHLGISIHIVCSLVINVLMRHRYTE